MKKYKTKIRLNWLLPVLVLAAMTGFSSPSRAVFAWQQSHNPAFTTTSLANPSYNKVINAKGSVSKPLDLPSSQITTASNSEDNCYTYKNGGYNIQLQYVTLGISEQSATNPSANMFSAVSLFNSCNHSVGKGQLATIIIGSVASQNQHTLTLSSVTKSSFVIAFNSTVENEIVPNYFRGEDQGSLPILSANYKYSQYKSTEEGAVKVALNNSDTNFLKHLNNVLTINSVKSLVLRC